MQTKSLLEAEFFKKVFPLVLMKAHAEENGPEENDPVEKVTSSKKDPTINFEQLISAARKEEKDKLYPTIKSLKTELAESTKNLNRSLLAETAAKLETENIKKELEAVKTGKSDPEEVAKLNNQIEALNAEIKALKESTPPDEEALRKQIESEYEVRYYRDSQLTENKDSILEVFEDLVTGSTKEEVDAAIKAAIEKSKSVKKQLGIVESTEEDPEETKKSETKPVQKQRPPFSNPSGKSSNTSDLTAADIAKMDVRSDEYKELRKKLGLK